MGIIRSGIHDKTTLFLKEVGCIDHFVETGTYYGNTALWASNHFKYVETVEFCKEIFDKAKENLKQQGNIMCYYGDSRVILDQILSQSTDKILFWLDAHWSSGNTFGENDQCPLLKELEMIFSDKREHIIMVDDARTFLSPPMPPNDPKQFPTIKELMDAIPHERFHTLILEDVIYVIPLNIWNKDTELFFQNEAKRADEYSFAKKKFYDKYSEIEKKGLKAYVIGEIKKKCFGTK